MLKVNEQTLDYEQVNEYIALLPNYEHTKLITTKELHSDEELYTYRYGERPDDAPMGYPVASFRDDEGRLCVSQTRYNHHTFTIASTGRGKTQGSVLNIAYNVDKRCSYIFTDPKNEVCKMSYNYLEQLYGAENIQIVNFIDPKQSTAFFNPFTDLAYEWLNSRQKENRDEIRNNIISEIDKICEILYPVTKDKDSSWEKTGRSLLQAIYYGLFDDLDLPERKSSQMKRKKIVPEQINFATVEKIFHSITYDRFNINDNGFFSERDKTSLAYTTSYSILHNAETTRANYFGFADLFVKMYSNAKIQAVSKYNTVKAEDYAKSPRVLFIIFNITDEKVREFVNICTARLVSNLLELSHKNGENIALKTPINFVLDEFDSLRACDVYKEVFSVGRGSGLYVHPFIQSYQQLAEKYPDKYLTMLDNADLQVFLGTNGDETAEKFAKGLGKSAKADPAAFLMGTLNVVELPVVTQDELLHRMNKGDSFIKRNGAMPLKVGYSLYYKTEEYKKYGLKDTGKFVVEDNSETEEQFSIRHADNVEEEDDKILIAEDEKVELFETLKNDEKEMKIDFDNEEFESLTDICKNDIFDIDDKNVAVSTEDEPEKIEKKEKDVIKKIRARKFNIKPNDVYENECMDVLEMIVAISYNYTRQKAIAFLEELLKESGDMEKNTITILKRCKKEFEIASTEEYLKLRDVVFNKW